MRPQLAPLVSVILATYNEARFIERSLGSLAAQQTPGFDLEILVVDGGSTDDTVARASAMAARDPRIRVLHNKFRDSPFAWNIGLRESRGQRICVFGAHNVYQPDYVATCVQEMEARGAVGCSGRVIARPENDSLQARLCCWVLGHPFGSSGNSFRTQKEGPVDSPAFPVLLKEAVIAAGGYSEELLRTEDNDMSRRLRAAGGTLWCTWKTKCFYYGKSNIAPLLRYAFRNGYWSFIGLKSNVATMSLRHFVPFVFTLACILSAMLAILAFPVKGPIALIGFATVCGSHVLVGLLSAIQVARGERDGSALMLPPLFLAFHFVYGLGTLVALVANANAPKAPAFGREVVQ